MFSEKRVKGRCEVTKLTSSFQHQFASKRLQSEEALDVFEDSTHLRCPATNALKIGAKIIPHQTKRTDISIGQLQYRGGIDEPHHERPYSPALRSRVVQPCAPVGYKLAFLGNSSALPVASPVRDH